ncbi:ribonuclease H-like domain-containing protein [Tanacetum coccineum]
MLRPTPSPTWVSNPAGPTTTSGPTVWFVRDNNCTIEFDVLGFSVKDFMMRQRLGHPGSDVLRRRLVSNNFISCNKEKPPVLCHACQLGKHVRLPFLPDVYAQKLGRTLRRDAIFCPRDLSHCKNNTTTVRFRHT